MTQRSGFMPAPIIACPHCRRKVRLSHKSVTVAEKCDCLWIWRQSPLSATVSLLCDSLTLLRQSHFCETVWTGLILRMTLNDLECPGTTLSTLKALSTLFCVTVSLFCDSVDRPLQTARLTLTYVSCGFRSWPCVTGWTWALAVSDKNVANELRFQSIWRLYEFSSVYCRRRTRVETLNLVIFYSFTLCSIISQISW